MSAIPEIAPPACGMDVGTGSGPVRERLFKRALSVYAALVALGLTPFIFRMPAPLKAVGMGLWLPGAGFLASGRWGVLLLAVTIAVFLAALFIRFATGALAFPLLVWLGSAILSGFTAAPKIALWVPMAAASLVVATGLYGAYSGARKRAFQLKQRERRIGYLPAAVAASSARATARPVISQCELTPRELAMSRYVLDRALQPVDQFQGFTHLDQFQPAALRYQLNFLHYSLAVLQCQFTPSFHGYLALAQRRLLEKFLDRRVWGYWIYESLLGRFSLDFDPIGWDNIMLGGFFNLNLGLYASNTGDRRYYESGALKFKLNGRRTYIHDAHSVNRTAVRNFQQSDLCLYPCEPRLVYPYCNLLGLGGVVVHDRIFGTADAAGIPTRFRKHLDEDFTGLCGTIKPGVDKLTGTTVDLVTGLYAEVGYAWLTNPYFTDLAQRVWAIARTEGIGFDAGGELALRTRSAVDRMDIGNYRKSELTTLALVAIAAREMGDEEVAAAALRRMDLVGEPITEGGVRRYNASNYTNAHIALAHFMRRDSWRSTLTQGPPAAVKEGPVLNAAPYPAVLVARAFSDGEALSLVLYPGGAAGAQTLQLARLRPGCIYNICGAAVERVTAGYDGSADVPVVLEGRTEVRIVPCH
jgi:hypothetical protein